MKLRLPMVAFMAGEQWLAAVANNGWDLHGRARRLAGGAAGLDEAGRAAVAARLCDAPAARGGIHSWLAVLWQCGLPVAFRRFHSDPEGALPR